MPDWFHASQRKAWGDIAPIVAICAGWQSGKTTLLPEWLKREIQRKGPGDYGAFSSTFKLLNRKFLPELKSCFKGLAEFKSSVQQFHFTDEGSRKLFGAQWDGASPTIIQLGHAENPDSLESATLKAVVWDECGQRLVPEQSYHTVRSRLMVNRGRMCLASKPYESGWFERLVTSKSPDVGVTTFPSWANPVNPPEDDPYWEQIRSEMPPWRFDMQYGGFFTKPAGLIYDCFDYEANTCEDFNIASLPCYPGMDFGKINTAGVAVAHDRSSGTFYVFGEYHAGIKRDYPDHVASMNALTTRYAGGKRYLPGCGGNKHGEDGWREAYRMHGLPLDEPPEGNIEVQIQAVWSLLNQRKLILFRSGAKETIEDLQHYARKVDEDGNVLDAIAEDAKYHRCFVAGTLIKTSRGDVPIEAVIPGDYVLTRQGFRRVLASTLTCKNAPVSRVDFSDGRQLTGTDNHPVFVKGRGWISIGALRYNDSILTSEEVLSWPVVGGSIKRKLSSTGKSSIGAIPRAVAGVIAAISKPSKALVTSTICIGASGRMQTGQSLRGVTSITRMATPQTTHWTTWSAWMVPSTWPFTQGKKSGASGHPHTLTGFDLWRLNGRAPRKVGLLFACELKNRGLESGGPFRVNASGAVLNFKPRKTEPTCIAPTSARQPLGANQALTTLQKRASTAEKSSWRTDTQERNPVPVSVLQVTAAGRADVYNLEVEDVHEYFANGILVHNCAALRYVISKLTDNTSRGFTTINRR